jgi:hypothetical protein
MNARSSFARSLSPSILLLALVLFGCEPARIVLPDTGPTSDAPVDVTVTPDVPEDAPALPALTVEVADEGELMTPRLGHTLTLLPSGHAVVIGGESLDRDAIASIEELDPITHTWAEVAMLPGARTNHTATLMADGRILIVGGGRSTSNGLPAGFDVDGSALLYDPVAHGFEEVGALGTARGHHAAIRLGDGSVLIVGGAGETKGGFTAIAAAERFLPDTRVFESAGALSDGRAMLRIESDGEGGVLAIGGLASEGGPAPVGSVERWTEGSFADAGDLVGGGRIYHATLRTSDGDVLVVGGLGAGFFLDSSEVWTSSGDAFVAGPDLPSPRNTVALVETDVGVIALGGFVYDGTAVLHDEILHVDVAAGTMTPIGTLPLGRAAHRAVTLPDGDVLVVGGYGAFGEMPQALRLHVTARE